MLIIKSYIFFVILGGLLLKSESARILAVLPVPMESHQMVFRVLLQELVKRGHEITVITALPVYGKDQSPVNYTEIDASTVTDEVRRKLLTEQNINVSQDILSQFATTYKVAGIVVDGLLGLKVVKDMVQHKNNYFDVIFLEDCIKGCLIFSHLFKAPVIQISSFGATFETFEIVGAATHPFLYPLAIRERQHNLKVWEKISELYLQYRLEQVHHDAEKWDDEVFRKHFGRDAPTLNKLKKNVDMVFLNIHPIWDSNRPVPPNVIYLGGLHRKPRADLPKDLKSSLDSSINGVIYVSFGTNINPTLLSPERIQIFIKVFSKLPYDVYWKWNDDKLPGLTKNIKILKWFPQSDLLFHPKVKVFITQGGLQSTDEAIAAGVPLIGIPMMWDQWFNVNKYVELKIGLQLDLYSITETKLKDAIQTVIQDESYKNHIVKLHSVMSDHLQSSLERAIWWTEYVIRHKGAIHLRAPSANMTWVEYYEVNLIILVLLSLIFILAIFVSILRILRLFMRKIKTD